MTQYGGKAQQGAVFREKMSLYIPGPLGETRGIPRAGAASLQKLCSSAGQVLSPASLCGDHAMEGDHTVRGQAAGPEEGASPPPLI